MEENLHNKDGLESYLVNSFEGYEGESPSDAVWEGIDAGIQGMAPVPMQPWYSRALTWKWAAGVAATLLIGTVVYQFLYVHQEIRSLKNAVADRNRQIEQLRQEETLFDSLDGFANDQPGAATDKGHAANTATVLPENSLSLTPALSSKAKPADVAESKDQSAKQQQASIAPKAPGAPLKLPASSTANAQMAGNEASSFLQKQKVTPVSPYLPAANKPVVVLPVEKSNSLANIPPQKYQLQTALPLAPTNATEGPVLPPIKDLHASSGIVLKIAGSTQARWLAMPEKEDDDHEHEAFSPKDILSQSDYRTGLGLILRNDKIISFETGLYLQDRVEISSHDPAFNYRSNGGPDPDDVITYQLYTPHFKSDVTVTVVPTTQVADSTKVNLSIVTREHNQSFQVPLLVRVSTPENRFRLHARGGLVLQYALQEKISLESVVSNDTHFAVSSDHIPMVRPVDEPKLGMGYLLGVGASWRINQRVGLAFEPYTYGSIGENERYEKPGELHDFSLFGGAEVSLYYHF